MPADWSLALLVRNVTILVLLGAMLAAWAWAVVRLARGRPLLPDVPIRQVPWSVTEALGIFLLYLAAQYFGGMFLFSLLPSPPEGIRRGASETILVYATVNLVVVVLAWRVLVVRSGATVKDLGLDARDPGREAVRGVVGGLLLTPVAHLVNRLAETIWTPRSHSVTSWISDDQPKVAWLLAALMAVVVAPVVEEFVVRGVLLGALGRRRRADIAGPEIGRPDVEPTKWPRRPGLIGLGANVAVSLLFAALHANVWPTPVALFVFSIALGTVYQRTGGLIAPVTMHAVFNAISTLVLILSVLAGVGPKPVPPVEPTPPVVKQAPGNAHAEPVRPLRRET